MWQPSHRQNCDAKPSLQSPTWMPFHLFPVMSSSVPRCLLLLVDSSLCLFMLEMFLRCRGLFTSIHVGEGGTNNSLEAPCVSLQCGWAVSQLFHSGTQISLLSVFLPRRFTSASLWRTLPESCPGILPVRLPVFWKPRQGRELGLTILAPCFIPSLSVSVSPESNSQTPAEGAGQSPGYIGGQRGSRTFHQLPVEVPVLIPSCSFTLRSIWHHHEIF